MAIVYLIINKDDGRAYIGKTASDSFQERWSDHTRRAKSTVGRRYLHNAMAKYGLDRFDICVIDRAETNKEVQALEEKYILAYRSAEKEFGFNLTYGGEGEVPNEATREKIRQARQRQADEGRPPMKKGDFRRTDISNEEIIARYLAGESCPQIAATYGASSGTISWRLRGAGITLRSGDFKKGRKLPASQLDILRGKRNYASPIKISLPNEELAHLYLGENLTLEQVGRRFGVGRHTVKARLKELDIEPKAITDRVGNAKRKDVADREVVDLYLSWFRDTQSRREGRDKRERRVRQTQEVGCKVKTLRN